MHKNVIDLGKSVSFILKYIDIGEQIQYLMYTGPFLKQKFFWPKFWKQAVCKKVLVKIKFG